MSQVCMWQDLTSYGALPGPDDKGEAQVKRQPQSKQNIKENLKYNLK